MQCQGCRSAQGTVTPHAVWQSVHQHATKRMCPQVWGLTPATQLPHPSTLTARVQQAKGRQVHTQQRTVSAPNPTRHHNGPASRPRVFTPAPTLSVQTQLNSAVHDAGKPHMPSKLLQHPRLPTHSLQHTWMVLCVMPINRMCPSSRFSTTSVDARSQPGPSP